MMSPVPGPEAPATGAAAASSLSPASPPLLQLRGVDKHFGAVQALYHVDLDLPAAQVTALCGDNGAGKSVLTRCIAGIHQPDHGEILWNGKPVHIRGPRDAADLGIEVVYQDLALADNLDIVQNMFLGRDPGVGRVGQAPVHRRRSARGLRGPTATVLMTPAHPMRDRCSGTPGHPVASLLYRNRRPIAKCLR